MGELIKVKRRCFTKAQNISYTLDSEIFSPQDKEQLMCETWSITFDNNEPQLVLVDCVFSFAGTTYLTPYALTIGYSKIGL